MSHDSTGDAASPFATSGPADLFRYEGRLTQDELDDLLVWAQAAKAADVKIRPGQPVWGHIAGRWQRITKRPLSAPECEMVARAVYGADNAVSEVYSGKPLDPAYEFKRRDGLGRLRFRCNVTSIRIPGGQGPAITLRSLPSVPVPLHQLGVEPDIMANFRPAQGMNLICGPTGSGKSTLMTSLVRWHCEREDVAESVVEYSKPVEFVYDGLPFPYSFVDQSDLNVDILARSIHEGEGESEWALAVANALRRKPDIIIIGEARDRDTIKACVEASLTGHLLLSTMHTIGVPETVRRVMMPFHGAEQRSIASDFLECINMVVTQLLLPRVGGGKVAVREFMVFDRKAKADLMGLDLEEWPTRIRDMLARRQVTGRAMSDAAKGLMEAGTITAETYEWIAARTSADSRLVRDAAGSGLLAPQGGLSGLAGLAAARLSGEG